MYAFFIVLHAFVILMNAFLKYYVCAKLVPILKLSLLKLFKKKNRSEPDFFVRS